MRGKLKPGLKVRHPHTRQFLEPEGFDFDPTDLFFAGLIRDGDLEIVVDDAGTTEKPKADDGATIMKRTKA